jgi:hypothetical protein
MMSHIEKSNTMPWIFLYLLFPGQHWLQLKKESAGEKEQQKEACCRRERKAESQGADGRFSQKESFDARAGCYCGIY